MARDLLVPGTGGTKLLLDGDDIGWPGELTIAGWIAGQSWLSVGFRDLGAKFGAPGDIRRVLSMEYPDDPNALLPTKTTLWPGGTLSAGPELHAVYNPFDGFEPFRYDWRQDIRRSAELLLQRLTGTPGDPWRIVCHSQGGLVVVAAAHALGNQQGGANPDRAFSKLVSHVAFLGTPFHGTLKAADALINGETLAAPVAAEFKQVARTWPALHQMLPTWLGCVRVPGPGGAEVDQMTNLLEEPPWAGQQILPSMLARARDTRTKYLRSPTAYLNGVKVRILQSTAHPTPDHVVIANGQLRVSGAVPGDTLVPDDVTRRMGGDIQSGLTTSIANATMVHSALAIDPTFVSLTKDFLKQ
jgi:hypothetical protein